MDIVGSSGVAPESSREVATAVAPAWIVATMMGGLLGAGCAAAPTSDGPGPELTEFTGTDRPASPPPGLFEEVVKLPSPRYDTGLALADMNGDGFADLVVASGNDSAVDTVDVWLNDRSGGFEHDPWWTSAQGDYNMQVAVGDIDGDGRNDLAVATLGFGDRPGGAAVYRNGPDGLEREPSFRTPEDLAKDTFAFTCAFGDVDGDGDLDLGVSFAEEPSASSATDTICPGSGAGFLRVYENQGGVFELGRAARWTSGVPTFGVSVTFADVTGDGLLDAIQGSSRVLVYPGRRTNAGIELETTPIMSQPISGAEGPGDTDDGFIFYLATGHLGLDRAMSIVASRNYRVCHPDGSGGPLYEAFAFVNGALTRTWASDLHSSGPRRQGAGVAIMEVGDGSPPEVVGTDWGMSGVEYFAGTRLPPGLDRVSSASPEPNKPNASPRTQAVASADLPRRCTQEVTESWPARGPVVTLSAPNVGRVLRVSVDDVDLPRARFAWTPGSQAVSVDSRRLTAHSVVRVTYEKATCADIVIIHQDHNFGTYVYRRRR